MEDNGVNSEYTVSGWLWRRKTQYMEQWLEYYELNKEFNSYEISNSIYRFCLYVPDEVMYAGNQYYFDGVSRLKERSDYVDLRYALNTGEDYVAISRERDRCGSARIPRDGYPVSPLHPKKKKKRNLVSAASVFLRNISRIL